MLALRVPAAFEIRELASDAADALAHEPPVDFELGFSLAEARSDATAHAMCCQMAPHATQTRVEVLVLGELDLQTALATRCMQGKDVEAAKKLLADAKAVEAAGACMVVMECVPAKLAARISEELTIPTIGIGAGAGCDGQVLVYQDLLAMYGDFRPKFVKVFANVGEVMREGVKAYIKETKEGTFPGEEHCFKIDDSVIDKLY